MVHDMAFKAWSAKPAINEIQMRFLTQPVLRRHAKAITGDQHADHPAAESRRRFKHQFTFHLKTCRLDK